MGQSTIKRNRSKQQLARNKKRRRRPRRQVPGWAIGVLVLGGIVALFWFTSQRPSGDIKLGARAPAFSLPGTDGKTVSLEGLRGRNALLYFSEGAGCDPCFTQIVELESHLDHLAELNTALVPVMPNPADTLREQITRFGLRTPMLIDDSLKVSKDYDTLGRGHHADLPGHSFVLVDGSGVIRWRGDYPSMYVSSDELLGEISKSVKG